MKFLRDRKEIAREINIKMTPVVRIDISKSAFGFDDCYKGDRIQIETPRYDYPVRCFVNMYGDEKGNEDHDHPWRYEKISLNPETICLTAGFGYSDVADMAEWSRTPIVKAGGKVVVMFDDPVNKNCYLRVMKVSDRIDAFCMKAGMLEDID